MNQQTPINHCILQSGVQNITVKLYPLGKIGEQDYNTLTENSRIEIDILKLDKATPTIKEYEVVKEYKITNFDDSNHKVQLEDLPYYEHTFIFNASLFISIIIFILFHICCHICFSILFHVIYNNDKLFLTLFLTSISNITFILI